MQQHASLLMYSSMIFGVYGVYVGCVGLYWLVSRALIGSLGEWLCNMVCSCCSVSCWWMMHWWERRGWCERERWLLGRGEREIYIWERAAVVVYGRDRAHQVIQTQHKRSAPCLPNITSWGNYALSVCADPEHSTEPDSRLVEYSDLLEVESSSLSNLQDSLKQDWQSLSWLC